MKEKERKHYHAPSLTKFGKVSQISASGAGSPTEPASPIKEVVGDEEYKEG